MLLLFFSGFVSCLLASVRARVRTQTQSMSFLPLPMEYCVSYTKDDFQTMPLPNSSPASLEYILASLV